MIKGLGVDLCSIARMKKAMERDGFVYRVFTDAEIAYAASHSEPARHFASAFAAREALAKAGGWGIGLMGLKSCQIERTKNGPRFIFSERLAARLAEGGITGAFLSLSHEGDMVIATVILEG